MVEIDRQIFVSLNYDKMTRMYYVLNDGNYMTKFYADNDEQAKQKFQMYLESRKFDADILHW